MSYGFDENEVRRLAMERPDLFDKDELERLLGQKNKGSVAIPGEKGASTPSDGYKRLWEAHERSFAEQCDLVMRHPNFENTCVIVQAGAPNRRIYKPGNQIVTIETGQGPTDFVGAYKYGPVGFDAKVTRKDYFAFKRPSKSSKGNWHQFEYMRALHRLDDEANGRLAIAGVFVMFIERDMEIRWADISEFTDNGRINYQQTWAVPDLFELLTRWETHVEQCMNE